VNPDQTQPGSWFAEEWTALLATVLESLGGERPKFTCTVPESGVTLAATSQEIGERHGAILWFEQGFPLPGEPAIWIGAPQKTWSQLAGRVLGAAGVEDADQARETYLEILQQSLAELARSAGRRWNQQLDCTALKEQPSAPPDGEFYLVEGAYPDAPISPLLIAVTGAPEDPPAETVALPEPAAQAPAPAGPQSSPSKTFDLLMGVELPVSVSFGHVQLALKEVLKLTAGSIIELNRTVDEPVEVIVNNCVVARGEVVVVEGNYGVRIHQIMSRQERLETLP
jgi:flagellar motor switch protein FliN/FliY